MTVESKYYQKKTNKQTNKQKQLSQGGALKY